MKNIHIIPTDKPSPNILLKKNDDTFQIFDTTFYEMWKMHQQWGDFAPSNAVYQHIYITSDEEIKEGVAEWGFDVYENKIFFPVKDWKGLTKGRYKKIILTTDQDLIKDGVQAIDDEFLEWFVKNPSCEEVETYSLGVKNQLTGESGHYKYEIIIPKEEPIYSVKV